MSILAGLKQKFPNIVFYNTNDPKYRSTKYGVNPLIPKLEDRPRCSVRGCCNPKAIVTTLKDGSPSYRKVCQQHHNKNIEIKNGVSRAYELAARRAGMTYVDYKNSKHPYRKHRLDYCENRDGRLGYECSSTIPWQGILQVDHIDGNPHNNCKSNLQTLCANCHAYKTHINQDTKTPGRKSEFYETLSMKGLA